MAWHGIDAEYTAQIIFIVIAVLYHTHTIMDADIIVAMLRLSFPCVLARQLA